MFTSDVMHEVELGWWKQIYMHILRILEALGGQRIYIFNDRYVGANISMLKDELTRSFLQVSTGSDLWQRYHSQV